MRCRKKNCKLQTAKIQRWRRWISGDFSSLRNHYPLFEVYTPCWNLLYYLSNIRQTIILIILRLLLTKMFKQYINRT